MASVTLTLDSSSGVLGYLLAVVVVDPFDRVVQIGGYDKAAYEVNSVILDWPQNWLSYVSNSLVGVREVTAAGLSSIPPAKDGRRNRLDIKNISPFRSGTHGRKIGRKSDVLSGLTNASHDDNSPPSWAVALLFGYDYM